MRLGKTSSQPAQTEKFILEPDPRAAAAPELTAYAKASTTIHAFRLAQKDIVRFDRLRKRGMVNQNSEERGKNSMSVGTRVCRTKHQLPKILPISTFMKFAETDEFVPLTLDTDIFSEIERDQIRENLPLCTNEKQ